MKKFNSDETRKLFTISDDLIALNELMNDLDGEIPEGDVGAALENYMATLDAERDEKLQQLCWVVDTNLDEAARLQSIVDYLKARIKKHEASAERLKNRMKLFFETHGIKSLDLLIFKPRIQKNSATPLIIPAGWEDHPTTAPKEFQRVVIELDKTAIREAVRNSPTGYVEGARMGETGTHFRLR